MKLVITAALAALAFVACTRDRVAYLDTSRLFVETTQGKQVVSTLQGMDAQRQQQVAAAAEDKREALDAKLRAALAEQDKRLAAPVVAEATKLAADIAKRRGYTQVQGLGGLLYSADDITADVVKAMNAVKPAPQATGPDPKDQRIAQLEQRAERAEAEARVLRADQPATKVAQAGPPAKPDQARKK